MIIAMNTTPTPIPAGKYVSKAQAAQLRGVSPITVQKWIEKGQLPTIQLEGMGHLIDHDKLMKFEPERGGRPKKSGR